MVTIDQLADMAMDIAGKKLTKKHIAIMILRLWSNLRLWGHPLKGLEGIWGRVYTLDKQIKFLAQRRQDAENRGQKRQQKKGWMGGPVKYAPVK
jgi:hypothetical protein